ncbi:SIMPL domain-containing protein [Cognaticolwellia mytili]|uniref:SIMPL domain-containing protein n=1 Tax=Cognaticolwellia mytili TaxID=1888913 RepID=UPI000A17129A|nr:SIMPL domain-containing protein [Cognaticolwellia mytili]
MRLYIVLLFLFNSMVYGGGFQQQLPENGIEVIGSGQVELQTTTHSLDILVNERGVSAVKIGQDVEQKIKLIRQFAGKHGSNINIEATNSVVLKVTYPALSSTIDDVEFLTRLPNERPVKINTKLNPKLDNRQNKHHTSIVVITGSQRMIVSVNDINAYQRLIDYLMKIGVNDVNTMDISHAEYQLLYQQALNNALADAKFKAKKMVNHLDISLAGVIAVQEMTVDKNYFNGNADKLKNHRNNELQSDERTVNAQVKVLFSIKPR